MLTLAFLFVKSIPDPSTFHFLTLSVTLFRPAPPSSICYILVSDVDVIRTITFPVLLFFSPSFQLVFLFPLQLAATPSHAPTSYLCTCHRLGPKI